MIGDAATFSSQTVELAGGKPICQTLAAWLVLQFDRIPARLPHFDSGRQPHDLAVSARGRSREPFVPAYRQGPLIAVVISNLTTDRLAGVHSFNEVSAGSLQLTIGPLRVVAG
jgi:hypothetical protein